MNLSPVVPVKSTAIHAVITRADGTIENLGLVSFQHRNPIIHWAVNAYICLKDYFHGHSNSK